MRYDDLKNNILRTLKQPLLNKEIVLQACNKLSVAIATGTYDNLMKNMGLYEMITKDKLKEAYEMLSEAYLRNKIATELGPDEAKYFPLGVLLKPYF